MKKEYSKPMAFVEDFSLQTNIAAGCEFKTNNQVEGTCGYPTRNGDVFIDTVQGCKYSQPDGFDGLCYHNPSDDKNLFNS